jgi:hypothetical protein
MVAVVRVELNSQRVMFMQAAGTRGWTVVMGGWDMRMAAETRPRNEHEEVQVG